MSKPSQWPLPPKGLRLLTPAFLLEHMHRHPLTRDCYPTAMGYYPQALGHRMRRSRHDDNLLLYCIEGRGWLRVNENRYPVSPGDLMLLPQGVAHSYASSRSQPWTIYWVHFQGVSTRIFMEYLGYREAKPVTRAGLNPSLASNFQTLLGVGKTGYSSRAFINAANHLRHIFTQFALAATQEKASQAAGLDLQALQAYMQGNIQRSLGLEELATVAHLSKYHFSSRYKALTGYSPIKHFLHMKMEYACQLLDSSDISIKAIAGELGYSDPLYFSRLFRQTLGLSPRAYRNSVRS